MNVGEWLMLQAARLMGVDDKEMIEIAPYCYLNRTAYEAGFSQAVARNVKGEAIPNVPIGNSLTPWREWASEHNGWRAKRSWL
jgi:hypothetical protein